MYHCSIRDYAQVATLPGNSRLAQRHDVIFSRDIFFDPSIKILVLEEDHRIVVANGGLDETLRIIGACRTNHFQSRRMHKPHLWILRMKWTSVDIAAAGSANHERRRCTPAVVGFRHHVDNLVESTPDEIHELKLGDGTHPGK